MRPASKRLLFATLVGILFIVPDSLSGQPAEVTISTPEQLEAEFTSVPCRNEERLNAVKALFEKMGAPDADISIQKYTNVDNLVVRKQGASEEKIVIGAHYDKVSDGCGAIDNWTGIVTIAHLYRSLKDVSVKKTVLFVAFGKEEKGLVGSRAMVDSITKDQRTEYCEMINIDSLGLTVPQVADNLSSKRLITLTANTAREMKLSFAHGILSGADADSTSFISKKISALTIHGLSNDWRSILHTKNDQPSKINPMRVYLGYRLALSLVVRLDDMSCGLST